MSTETFTINTYLAIPVAIAVAFTFTQRDIGVVSEVGQRLLAAGRASKCRQHLQG